MYFPPLQLGLAFCLLGLCPHCDSEWPRLKPGKLAFEIRHEMRRLYTSQLSHAFWIASAPRLLCAKNEHSTGERRRLLKVLVKRTSKANPIWGDKRKSITAYWLEISSPHGWPPKCFSLRTFPKGMPGTRLFLNFQPLAQRPTALGAHQQWLHGFFSFDTERGVKWMRPQGF